MGLNPRKPHPPSWTGFTLLRPGQDFHPPALCPLPAHPKPQRSSRELTAPSLPSYKGRSSASPARTRCHRPRVPGARGRGRGRASPLPRSLTAGDVHHRLIKPTAHRRTGRRHPPSPRPAATGSRRGRRAEPQLAERGRAGQSGAGPPRAPAAAPGPHLAAAPRTGGTGPPANGFRRKRSAASRAFRPASAALPFSGDLAPNRLLWAAPASTADVAACL